MPTLVTIEVPATQSLVDGSNTARTADVEWMEREILDGNGSANDSTLSGSLLAAALEDIKTQRTTYRPHDSHRDNDSLCSNTMDDSTSDKVVLNDDCSNHHKNHGCEDIDASRTLDESACLKTAADSSIFEKSIDLLNQTSVSRTLGESYFNQSLCRSTGKENKCRPRRERIKGPMEERYEAEYQTFVQTRIHAFRKKHPNTLPEYRTLSPTRREKEQVRVLKLLQRLHITSSTGADDDRSTTHDKSLLQIQSQTTEKIREKTRSQERSIPCNDSDDTTMGDTMAKSVNLLSPGDASLDKSMALLTPAEPRTKVHVCFKDVSPGHDILPTAEPDAPSSPSIDTKSMALLSPISPKMSVSFQQSNDDDSIEIARSAMPYDSPQINELDRQSILRKRMATSSGKRGADVSRARTSRGDDDDSFESFGHVNNHDTPSKDLEASMRRLSMEPSKVFTSSQSPISPSGSEIIPRDMHVDSDNEFSQTNVSFGDRDSDNRSLSHATDSLRLEETMLEQRKVHWKFSERQLHEAPANVRVKNGGVPFLRPLDFEYNHKTTRSPPTRSYPDPLEGYIDRVARRLERLCKWMHRQEKNKSVGGLILSLQPKQVVDLTLKMLLDRHERQGSCDVVDETVGQTLVVARTKEDLDEWARAFLEGSGFSVLNHASLPLKERQTQSTAIKCAHFDVVLSTFDALKAPDSNVTIDTEGIAVKNIETPDNGWFNSRSSQLPEGKEVRRLSVLHQLAWKRVVLVDVVGKKCYVAKPGTTRAIAARALCSESRFLFAIGSADDSPLNDLIRSHRNALESIASVLQIDEDPAEEILLQEALLDFADSSTIR